MRCDKTIKPSCGGKSRKVTISIRTKLEFLGGLLIALMKGSFFMTKNLHKKQNHKPQCINISKKSVLLLNIYEGNNFSMLILLLFFKIILIL